MIAELADHINMRTVKMNIAQRLLSRHRATITPHAAPGPAQWIVVSHDKPVARQSCPAGA